MHRPAQARVLSNTGHSRKAGDPYHAFDACRPTVNSAFVQDDRTMLSKGRNAQIQRASPTAISMFPDSVSLLDWPDDLQDHLRPERAAD